MSSTVNSVSAAVGHLSRQSTGLESAAVALASGAAGAAFFQVDDNPSAAAAAAGSQVQPPTEVDSLLHQKLLESNIALSNHFETIMADGLGRVPVQLRSSMKSLNTTQNNLQETVSALQESSQTLDKLINALDGLVATSKETKFPVW